MNKRQTYKKSHVRKKVLIISILIVLVGGLFSIFTWLTRPMQDSCGNVLSDRNYYIAHAAGALDGYRYLNCREALIRTINNGYKYIEFDLGLTKDSVLVCLHDWKLFHKMTSQDTLNEQPLTANEYKVRKIYHKYTPLTIEDVLIIRNHHPFVIVTDKISKVDVLNKSFKQDRNNIMVETYTVSDYKLLNKSGYSPMLSLRSFDYYKLIKYFIFSPLIKRQKIDWICVNTNSNMKSLRILKRLFNCKVAMYTSNSPTFFNNHLGKEVDLIYTDATTSH